MSVSGERRALGVTATVTAGGTVAICALIARDTAEAQAFAALVVSVGAVAVACAGLAGYALWLRRAVSRRMITVLRPYLEPRIPSAAVPAAAPVARARSPIPANATSAQPGFALLGPGVEN